MFICQKKSANDLYVVQLMSLSTHLNPGWFVFLVAANKSFLEKRSLNQSLSIKLCITLSV